MDATRISHLECSEDYCPDWSKCCELYKRGLPDHCKAEQEQESDKEKEVVYRDND